MLFNLFGGEAKLLSLKCLEGLGLNIKRTLIKILTCQLASDRQNHDHFDSNRPVCNILRDNFPIVRVIFGFLYLEFMSFKLEIYIHSNKTLSF